MGLNMMNYIKAKNQNGTVLVLSLIILSVLTLVAVTGMKTSVNEEKMTGNLRDRELAYQAAEAALRQARTDVDAMTSFATLTNTNGLLKSDVDDPDYYDPAMWYVSGNYQTIAGGIANGQLANVPRFVVQHSTRKDWCKSATEGALGEIQGNAKSCPSDVFLLTAHGTGLSADTTMALQEYFGRPVF